MTNGFSNTKTFLEQLNRCQLPRPYHRNKYASGRVSFVYIQNKSKFVPGTVEQEESPSNSSISENIMTSSMKTVKLAVRLVNLRPQIMEQEC